MLVSPQRLDEFDADLRQAAVAAGVSFQPVLLPDDPSARLDPEALAEVEMGPLPAESPLSDLPNVILSPHSSGDTAGNIRRSTEIFFENIGPCSLGQPLRN